MITAPTITALPSSPWPFYQRGVYVHIPFCITRCHYCDFNAYAGLEALIPDYLRALTAEIESRADGEPVTSIFFGGGTPTRMPPEFLGTLLGRIRDAFDVARDAEVSIEANPESVDSATLDALLIYGFNRISIGVQSTDPGVLSALGRVHSPGRAVATVKKAVSAGFDSVNADLIYGTPGETEKSWYRSLSDVIEAGPPHISAYALTVEEGTPLHARVAKGEQAPDEDEQADRYESTVAMLATAGYQRYEVSNFARDSKWCLHNVLYWTLGDYLGFGAGAHAHMQGRRTWNLRTVAGYIAASPLTEEGGESLEAEQQRAEAAILGLRLAGGIRRSEFAGRYGADPVGLWSAEFAAARERGLLEIDDGSIRPSERGFFMLNQVFRELVILSE